MRNPFHICGIVFSIVACAFGAAAQQTPNYIYTVAGGGSQPSAATSAYLPEPYDAVRDKAGNTYIAVPSLNTVYEVNVSGAMTVYAGTGTFGFSGDGGPASSAQLAYPEGLAIDANGNLFIADTYNERIRRVDATTHNITTVAGSGDPEFGGSYQGDGNSAIIARLNNPESVAVDANGNLFIADTNNGVIREVSASTGNISTYAGNIAATSAGCPSGSATATNVGFGEATGVAVDASGNVFVSDEVADVVCKVTTSQTISVYAGTPFTPGTPGQANGDGGAATLAKLLAPRGLATDPNGNLYITDAGEPKIREVVASTGFISTVAGDGFICGTGGITPAEPACGDGGAATSAAFDYPEGVFYDTQGNLVVADTYDMRVRVIGTGTNPTVNALAGGGNGGDGSAGANGILAVPQYVAVDSNENVYALESNGARLRELSAPTGNLSTVAGDGYGGATVTCVGSSCSPGASNGDGAPATQARFVFPNGLAIDSTGNYYILDSSTYVVRVVNNQTTPITVTGVTIQPGDIETIAGNGVQCTGSAFPACGDNGPATSASLSYPDGVAVDASGNVYISDAGLNTVRIINGDGFITTYAGTAGQSCTTYVTTGCGNGGVPASALLNFPSGLATSDVSGSTILYIADAGDNVIREVGVIDDEFTILPVAFNGYPTFGGDDNTALYASMNFPQQVAVDNLGNLFVSGGYDNVVRRIDASDGTVMTVAGDVNNLDGGFSGDGGPSTQAQLSNYGVAVFNTANATHDIFIADGGNNRIRKVPLAPEEIESGELSTFPNTLAGSMSPYTQDLYFSNSGLDDLILTVTKSGTNPTAFVLENCNSTATPNVCTLTVSPGNAQYLEVLFEPPVGTSGSITATLTITGNDPVITEPLVFSLSGNATGPVQLTASISPTGGGNVSSVPAGIACPAVGCTGTFATGSPVTVFATPNSGYAFQSWNVGNAPDAANCATDTTGDCTFTITQSESISANFQVYSPTGGFTLTVSPLGNGTGTVTSNPAGINCPGTCSFSFGAGVQSVVLTATPTASNNSVFAGWFGYFCSGQGTCTVPAVTTTVAPVFSGPPQPFASGQVFLSTGNGMVFVLNPANGNVVQVLNSGATPPSSIGQGMAFDSAGNLYVGQETGQIQVFSNQAAGPTLFGYGDCPCGNEVTSLVFDSKNNLFAGNEYYGSDDEPTIAEYPPTAGPDGVPSNAYYPAYERGAAPLWIELLDTNDRFAYTLGSQTLKVFNFVDYSQRPDISATLHQAYALRELPDKTILVADSDRIVRIDQSGNIQQTYAVPGVSAFFENLNLDPDGVTFWTNDYYTGNVYRINIQTGAVANTGGYATNLGLTSAAYTGGIGGIAVYGQPQSGGADLSVTMTAPASVQQGANITYTVNVTNAGPLNATGIVLNATIPDALPVSLAPNTCTSTANGSSTSISCPLGTINSGQGVDFPITFTMSPSVSSGTITATASIGASEPDPNLTNNTATTTTTVGSGASSVQITSASPLPAGTVNTAYSVTLAATGGTTPYTWSINTGSPPPGLNLSAGGVISGTPTEAGTYIFEVQVRDSSNPVERAMGQFSLTVNAASGGGGLTFTSTTLPAGAVTVPYGADIPVSGGTPPYTVALTTGSSLPSGFSMDAAATGNAAAGHVYNLAPKTAGTYTFGVEVTDSTPSAPQTATATISLTIAAMPANTQPGLLNGQYAFLVRAFDETTGTEHAVVGSFTFDGKGNITAGEIDNNSPGTNGIYNAQVTGVYSIGSDNRGVMSVTPTGQTAGIFTIAVGNVSGGVASNATVTLFLDDNATGQIGSGVLVKQDPTSFTKASFAGTYVFGLTGQDTSLNRAAELGIITFDNAGNVTSAAQDINDNGETVSSSFKGTYTGPDSNGRIVETNGSSTSPDDAIYLISANEGIAVTVEPRVSNPILVGSGFRQSTGTFSATSIAGPDVLSVAGVADGGTEALVGLLTATAGTSPTVSLTSDANDGGNLMLNKTQTGSYTVAANGSATLNFGTPVIVGLWQKDEGFVLSTDSSVSFGTLTPQTGGPFTAASLTGKQYLGPQEAIQGAHSAFSATGTASGSVLSATNDESHSGGNLFFGQSLGSLNFTIASNGHFTVPQGATSGALTGYLVSPNEAIFFDTTGPTSDPANSVSPLLIVSQSVTAGSAPTAPALAITKTHTGNFVLGLQGTYTITISNGTGAGATTGTVTVADNAPDGLTIYSMSGTGWACDGDVCNRSDALAGGASYPAITVVVNVAENATSPQVNSATVSGGGSASATANDSTVVAPPLPVATLNPASGSTIAFGDQGVGSTSAPQKVTLTNTGNVNLTVSSIAVTETGGSGDFAETNDCPESLTPSPATGSSCTISVTFTPAAVGQYSGTLTVQTGDPNHPSQAINLTGTGAIVTLAPGPGGSTTATVNPGQTAVFPITLSAPPGVNGTVTLSCSSPDASITCAIVPSTVTLNGTAIQTAIVVNTYCQGSTPVGSPAGKLPLAPMGGLCVIAALALAAMPGSQRRRLRLALVPAALAVILIFNASCGNLPKSPTGAATPPGTYTLDIKASLGNSSSTLPVTLVVK